MAGISFYVVITICLSVISLQEIGADRDLKCQVCKRMVREIISAIKKEDPRKTLQVGSYRIQPDGSQNKMEIKYAGSETHLHEIFEDLCDTMSEYAQAKHKRTSEKIILKISEDIHLLSDYEFIPDPELNRGLKSYCQLMLGEYEEEILGTLRSKEPEPLKATRDVCIKIVDVCDEDSSQQDGTEPAENIEENYSHEDL